MKKIILFVLLFAFTFCQGQQLPYFTQYTSQSAMLNPACTGTKRKLDARLFYRTQWVGFEGAPLTQGISVNSRLFKGRLGVGGSLVSDETGPTKRSMYSVAPAFHIHFPDMEMSLGMSLSFIKYSVDGSKITIRSTRDAAIDQALNDFDWAKNASAGLYLHNDRFHFGISALNMLQTQEEFYRDSELKKGIVELAPHYYINIGYNYAADPKFVWRNAAQVKFAPGAPMVLDYNLNMYFDNKFFVGTSIRLKDAIAVQMGIVIKDDFQACYSYDIMVSPLKEYSSGSHEIMLVYSTNFTQAKKGGRNKEFARQKYGYMF